MMKEKQVAALVVSIFGFYILWQAFAVGGLQALVFLFSLIGDGANKSIGIAALSFGVPIFLALFILGIIFIRNAPGIGNWILRIRFRPLPDEEGDPLDVATFAQISHLAFSLLGLFLFVQTVPYALRDASHWMQVQFWSSAQINVMGHEERPSFLKPCLTSSIMAPRWDFRSTFSSGKRNSRNW